MGKREILLEARDQHEKDLERYRRKLEENPNHPSARGLIAQEEAAIQKIDQKMKNLEEQERALEAERNRKQQPAADENEYPGPRPQSEISLEDLSRTVKGLADTVGSLVARAPYATTREIENLASRVAGLENALSTGKQTI